MKRIAVTGDSPRGRLLLDAAGQYGLTAVCGCSEDADILYLPDYSSLGFTRINRLLKSGRHILIGGMGVPDMKELAVLSHTATEHQAVLLEYLDYAFNPCLKALADAVQGLGPVYRIRFYSCQCSFRCQDAPVPSYPVRPAALHSSALFQRGLDCIYPMARIFGVPDRLETDMVFCANGLDAAGSITGNLGPSEVELVYSKISGSHIPSLIQGKRGSLLIRDIRDFRQIIYISPFGKEEILFSCTDREYAMEELIQSMSYITGNLDWSSLLPVSRQVLKMMQDVLDTQNRTGTPVPEPLSC